MAVLPASIAVRSKGRGGDRLTFGGSRKGIPEFCLGKDGGILPSLEEPMPAGRQAAGGCGAEGPVFSLVTLLELSPVSESSVVLQAPSLSQTGGVKC